ncbi:hypothetical protein ZIOFF_045454 [Zingiber officinale]|uniref:Phytocyanin domain-containing protein n=1 Tax=Zingiber officinale TaxID=94328 RepID=A0A8J5FYL6_ZINOF|nr:hypothetical protein ZIOFF_045454 [Zingiber officinale]
MATRLFLLMPAMALLCLSVSGNSTEYTVGGRAGWDISADLASWVASKIFYVGDSLGTVSVLTIPQRERGGQSRVRELRLGQPAADEQQRQHDGGADGGWRPVLRVREPAALPGRDETQRERGGKRDRRLRGGSVADDINGAGRESGDAAVPERWFAVLEWLSWSRRELHVGVRLEFICVAFLLYFFSSWMCKESGEAHLKDGRLAHLFC